jgi:hypothetical protein
MIYFIKGGDVMKTRLNTSIEKELMLALLEYLEEIKDTKSAVTTAALLKAIPRDILIKNKVKGI